MRNAMAFLATALTALLVQQSAFAASSTTIDCPLRAMSANAQKTYAAALIDDADPGKATDSARAFITPLAESCGKAGRWDFDRVQNAISWTLWSLMTDRLLAETGMTATDAAILRTYYDQHAAQLEGMMEYSAAQRIQLIGELRRLGAHLHDDGSKVSEQELTIILLAQQMRREEAGFGSSK